MAQSIIGFVIIYRGALLKHDHIWLQTNTIKIIYKLFDLRTFEMSKVDFKSLHFLCVGLLHEGLHSERY